MDGCASSSWRSSTARRRAPRVGVLDVGISSLADAVREAGGEPVPIALPPGRPPGGVALAREWVADWAQISCVGKGLDALLVNAEEAEELAGFLVAAVRLGEVPMVVAPTGLKSFGIVPYALGLSPLGEDPAEVAVAVARNGGPLPGKIVGGFSLANALRAVCSLDGGPEAIVHLAAVARETGQSGFGQMIRVLVPETPAVTAPTTGWYAEHGAAGLLGLLGETLNDTRTLTGSLKEKLPEEAPPAPGWVGARLLFVRGRASGAEGLCRVEGPETEVAGMCRIFGSEADAARAVKKGLEGGTLPVVAGCGPRGGPGLVKLERLGEAFGDAGLAETVITDGLAPSRATGVQISLFSPEAAAGGVIGLLRDGDLLRLDLAEGLIRTGVKAGEMGRREPFAAPVPSSFGYCARYARAALPALDGAGFG